MAEESSPSASSVCRRDSDDMKQPAVVPIDDDNTGKNELCEPTQASENGDEASAPPMPAPQPIVEALPQVFVVKYLGKRDARGLWGIKHTRKPVDEMVATAKALKPGSFLPFLQLHVSEDGVRINEMPQNQNKNFEGGLLPIDIISYGVQDLVYTRVFAMIVVRDGGNFRDRHPFECHAYVCDSRDRARRLTFSLATAFQVFSRALKEKGPQKIEPKKFAIDLRSPEEIEADMKETDSEA